MTASGQTLEENLKSARIRDRNVIRPLDNPFKPDGGLRILRGNLCPDGAVIKPAACDPKFYRHKGPALVFDSYPEMKAAIDDDNLAVTPDTVMVLRNAGPLGGPGFPEWGMLPIPKALLKQGHRDMLRISDARMSGTSYGACVLHVAPESFIGGPLALLRTGDIVRLDLDARRLDMVISEAELAQRSAEWTPPKANYHRGYGWMFSRHVTQADQGCDFDFLERDFGAAAGEPAIY
jgi:dihydroxy-acid dehydratase